MSDNSSQAGDQAAPGSQNVPCLVVTDARKRFRRINALDGVDLRVEPGEWLALLGPNGAGKTTLVRSIGGHEKLDSGSIELFGRDTRKLHGRSRREGLGVVPQEIALYPLLTARENLSCFAQLLGVPSHDRRDRIDQVLEWTGLVERSDQVIKHFSGGMQRRLNIGCSILHEPKLLLLDEPTVGVDPQSRERIWSMLAELRQKGTSLVLTTHQLDEAEQTADRIVIIDHGKNIASGTMGELVEQTIGNRRNVEATFTNPIPEGTQITGFEIEENRASGSLERLDSGLSEFMNQIHAAGLVMQELHVESPNLRDVFLQLTGKDLRE